LIYFISNFILHYFISYSSCVRFSYYYFNCFLLFYYFLILEGWKSYFVIFSDPPFIG
jgi:hypothetical protein